MTARTPTPSTRSARSRASGSPRRLDYSIAWGPAWGQVTPFAIPSASGFQPPPPPALNSPEYTAAYNEVMSLGAQIARLARPTRPRSPTSGRTIPGSMARPWCSTTRSRKHWRSSSITRSIRTRASSPWLIYRWPTPACRPGMPSTPTASGGPSPASSKAIATATSTPWATPTGSPWSAPGDGIRPNYTPPFPAYLSGHATFGGALFQTLTDFYGTDNVSFSLTSDELPGVVRHYTSFSQAAQENGQSRIYLGIHWQFDKTNGIAVGDAIGNYVFQHILN